MQRRSFTVDLVALVWWPVAVWAVMTGRVADPWLLALLVTYSFSLKWTRTTEEG